MKGEWCYFKKWFTDEQCDQILQLAMTIKPTPSRVGIGERKRENRDIRRSDIRFIDSTDERFHFLFDDLWRMAIRANADWFDFHITRLDFIQLAEYDSRDQGEYKKHQDVFWVNHAPDTHRKLTCVVQLTDPNEYEGGDLSLYHLADYPNPEDLRQRGTVIFFPSFTYHAAQPVLKGVRHSIACWFIGPQWR